MSFPNYHCISSLTEKGYQWRLRVRVINMWESINLKSKKIVGLNMLFVDETNTRILAFAGLQDYHQFQHTVIVGKIYTVSNFQVKKYNDETFTRPVRNDFRLFLSNYTQFEDEEVNYTLIPHIALDLYDLCDVEKLSSQNIYLTDVIGVVEEVKMTFTGTTDVPKTMVPIFISDGRYTAKVLFWNTFGEYFLEQMAKVTEKPVILAISCCDIHFSNTPATKIYLNPDHYSVDILRKKLEESPVRTHSKAKQQMSCPQMVNLADLNSMDIHMLNKTVVFVANFTEYAPDKIWYEYFCTKCQLQVEKQPGKSRCSVCNKNMMFPNKRFKIHAVAKDETGKATILLLDPEVRKIVGKFISQVENNKEDVLCNHKVDGQGNMPVILNKILDNEFQVSVLVGENNLTGGDTIYTCTNIEVKDELSVLISSAENSPNPAYYNMAEEDSVINQENFQHRGTPSTEGSSTKERVRKLPEGVPFNIDENLPINSMLRVSKKERLAKP